VTSSIVNVVKNLKDSAIAKVRLSFRDRESIHLDCVYKEADAPGFFLVFPPETIPDYIDFKETCSVSINSEESSIVVSAKIQSRKNDRTLEMSAMEMLDPVSLREYFRVLYKTSIIASHEPSSAESRTRSWKIEGSTVDLSGTGVLGIFPKEFENRHNIFLDFDLPGLNKSVQCVAHVVRVRRIRKTRFQIALHFDHITRKNRDAVITACLQEQRRQLRQRMSGE